MRIWDISPGYLNDKSLLGEHRELHGIVSIITGGKKGYSRHPETIRWVDHIDALSLRHRQLSAEMMLRGFNEKSPVAPAPLDAFWPVSFIDSPAEQYDILNRKYETKSLGRISLPRNIQELWSHHKYSMLARDQEKYKEIGPLVARDEIGFADLAELLVAMLRTKPDEGGIRNTVQHMWGHVSDGVVNKDADIERWSVDEMLVETIKRATESTEPYLLSSTAIGELPVWTSSVRS